MKLVKECGIGSKFLPGQSYSCIFQANDVCCAAITGERRLYCHKENNTEIIELSRPYFKISTGINAISFYGCTLINQRNEANIYCLDECFRETDYFSIKLEGIGRLTDLWFDSGKKILFLVHVGSVEKFNLNGDYLGRFMKAPGNTKYLAMCTWTENIYLIYDRGGCVYIAEYNQDGSYFQQLSLGNSFQIMNMFMEKTGSELELMIYAIKTGGISVCLVIASDLCDTPEAIRVEFIRGEGIGEVTCGIKPPEACH